MGWHLDTPSEIILQARLRMHFEGGQGSFFFNAGQWHRLAACSLALLLFSHSGSNGWRASLLEGAVCQWHTIKAPTEPAGEKAVSVS